MKVTQSYVVKTDRTEFTTTGTDKLEVINRVNNQLRLQSYLFGVRETLRDVSLKMQNNAMKLST